MCTFNIFYIIFLCKCSIDLKKMCYPLIISPGFAAASSSCTLQCVPAHVYVTLKNGLSMRFARYARMARTSIVLYIYIIFCFSLHTNNKLFCIWIYYPCKACNAC